MVLHHRRGLVALLLGACAGHPSTDTGDPDACADFTADFEAPDVVPVGEPLAFTTAGEGDCASHLWDFGDGTQSTESSPAHRYDAPGHHPVVHRLTFTDGSTRSATRVVTAFLPAIGPTSASSTLLPLGEDYLVAVPEVGVVRTGPGGLTVWEGCDTPRTLARGDLGTAVACEGSGELVLLDDDLVELDRVALGLGSRPWGVAWDGAAYRVTLTATAELARWDGSALDRTDVTADPRALAIGPTGSIYVSRFRSPDGMGLIDVVGAEPLTLPFADVVDSDNSSRGVPNLLEHLLVSPDGGTLYAPGQVSNTARGTWRDGQSLTHETTVRAILRGLDTATGDTLRPLDRQFDNHGRSGPIALSPLGDWLWVAFPDTAAVFQVDAYTGRTVSSIPDAGRALTGLVATEDTVAVHAWLDREVRVFDAATAELLAVYPTVHVEPLTPEVLLGKQIFHDAIDRRITRDGYISCAVCHPGGDQDGLVWDFTDRGEGLRNTSSLLGRAGMGMGRLHWSGNFDEVQDFEHDLRGPFAGDGFLLEADWLATDDPLGAPKAGRSAELDALAAYLTTLDEVPASPFATSSAGEALFSDLGCASCHPAPTFTDSSLDDLRHDVGTLTPASGSRLGGVLDGLDTPTLLGVHGTGPWLHDGSATTLESAIEAHEGLPRSPAASELTQLADFLRSL